MKLVYIISILLTSLSACGSRPAAPKELASTVVHVESLEGQGTGVLTKLSSGELVVLTNSHLCVNMTQVIVIMTTGEEYQVKAAKLDYTVDLCIYKFLSPLQHTYAALTLKRLVRGEPLLSIGYPGLNGPLQAAVGRYIGPFIMRIMLPVMRGDKCPAGPAHYHDNTQWCLTPLRIEFSTLAAYPGSSGSPVFNGKGEWVGIVNSSDMEHHAGFLNAYQIDRFLRSVQ